jgi:N-carbamoyl-L-amino-acid hydrolase
MGSSTAVREDRLWQRHMDMAKLGGTPKGGVNRQVLPAEDAAARNLLGSWAKAHGFSTFTDAIGNLPSAAKDLYGHSKGPSLRSGWHRFCH